MWDMNVEDDSDISAGLYKNSFESYNRKECPKNYGGKTYCI